MLSTWFRNDLDGVKFTVDPFLALFLTSSFDLFASASSFSLHPCVLPSRARPSLNFFVSPGQLPPFVSEDAYGRLCQQLVGDLVSREPLDSKFWMKGLL